MMQHNEAVVFIGVFLAVVCGLLLWLRRAAQRRPKADNARNAVLACVEYLRQQTLRHTRESLVSVQQCADSAKSRIQQERDMLTGINGDAVAEIKNSLAALRAEWAANDAPYLERLRARYAEGGASIASHLQNKHLFQFMAARVSAKRKTQLHAELAPLFARHLPGDRDLQTVADQSSRFGQDQIRRMGLSEPLRVRLQQTVNAIDVRQKQALKEFCSTQRAIHEQLSTAVLRVPAPAFPGGPALPPVTQPLAALRASALPLEETRKRLAAALRMSGWSSVSGDRVLAPSASAVGQTDAALYAVAATVGVVALAEAGQALGEIISHVQWDAVVFVHRATIEQIEQAVMEHIAIWLLEEFGIHLTAEMIESILASLTVVILVFKIGRYAYKAYKIFVRKEPLEKARRKIHVQIREQGGNVADDLGKRLEARRNDILATVQAQADRWRADSEEKNRQWALAAIKDVSAWQASAQDALEAGQRKALEEIAAWKRQAERQIRRWQWAWF